MKKLLAMLGAAGLVVSTGAVIVSCGTDPAPVETTQEITITEGTKFDKAVEESTIAIASVKLDDKAVEGDFMIAATVDAETKMIVTGTLTAPKELAVGTYTVSLEADEFKSPEAFEEAEPTKVITTFTFEIKEADNTVELNTVLTVKTVKVAEDKIEDVETVKAAIIAANEGLDDKEVEFGTITEGKISVSVKEGSKVYKGEAVEVTIEAIKGDDEAVELNTVLTVKTVKVAEDKIEDVETVKAAIIAANEGLDDKEVEFGTITEGKISVSVKEGSKVYKGEAVEVTIEAIKGDDEAVELNTVLTVKTVKVAEDKIEDVETVKAAIIAANEGLDDKEVEFGTITEGKISVSVKEGSKVYKGEAVEVTIEANDDNNELFAFYYQA
ncbi:lipoprotein [Spiroplasma endosymbiont of Othius punctulatus]|uniref:lipoprotein n=1 Tax=Spiroplasma endosymbiont of Othius punctulatus TaxID=3066289 RepID=UPI0030CD1710